MFFKISPTGLNRLCALSITARIDHPQPNTYQSIHTLNPRSGQHLHRINHKVRRRATPLRMLDQVLDRAVPSLDLERAVLLGGETARKADFSSHLDKGNVLPHAVQQYFSFCCLQCTMHAYHIGYRLQTSSVVFK